MRAAGATRQTALMPPTIAEVHAALTAPGQMFEMEEVVIRGVPTRTWKLAPPSLRAVLERPLLVDETLAARTEELAVREITVLADKSLPYEVVKKVMSTCTAASYGKISLAVIEKEKPLDAAALNTA